MGCEIINLALIAVFLLHLYKASQYIPSISDLKNNYKIDKIIAEISQIKIELSQTKNELSLTKNELSQTKNELSQTKNELSQIKSDNSKFREIHEVTSDEKTIPLTYSSSVIVEIEPVSALNNSLGSGTLITLDEKLYISTCRHVLINTQKNCKRRITSIRTYKEIVSINPENVYFPNSLEVDAALIEVKPEWTTKTNMTAVRVSENNVSIFSKLWGTTYREKGLVGVPPCHIVELDSNQEKRQHQSNCGGTHGFSGMGYLGNEILRCIHTGEGEITHMDPKLTRGDKLTQSDNEFSSWSSLEQKAKNNCIGESVFTEICFLSFLSLTHLQARNPRTTVTDASVLHSVNLNNNSFWINLPECLDIN